MSSDSRPCEDPATLEWTEDVDDDIIATVAVYSLRARAGWRRLSEAATEEIAAYFRPLEFGAAVVVMPAGYFTGSACYAYGDEVFVADHEHYCVSVLRDGGRTFARRIGEGQLLGVKGLVANEHAVFVTPYEVERDDATDVVVYPRAGGPRTKRFYASSRPRCGRDTCEPAGLAVAAGRVYVADQRARRVNVLSEEGEFIECCGEVDWGDTPCHVAVADGVLYVAYAAAVRVFTLDNLRPQRCLQYTGVSYIRGVCAANGLVFVVDQMYPCILVFDCADGRSVTAIDLPALNDAALLVGVTVSTSGTLFIVVADGVIDAWPEIYLQSRLCAVQMC